MIILTGAAAIVASAIVFVFGLATYGRSGPWFGICVPLFFILFFGGIVIVIFGAGWFFASPHTIHIGG